MEKDLDKNTQFNYTIKQGVKPKTKPTAKTKEGKVKLRVREVLDVLPYCWYFMPVSKGYSRGGIPDFIGCVNGRMFAIETKSKYSSHKVTALQRYELDRIDGARGLALVINEDNVEDLERILTNECINGRL